ncbi:MAG TPA: dihydrolipoamide acetyltransferase family protein [Roseiarcus sp.]|nr:dihydrolipoamide acetyltransferase family protein [Roseiarcus sp.]
MDFLVPKLSSTMESAKVLRWLKKAGDKVAMGEPLVEIETDKAAMEVESPVDATLEAVLAEEGAELPIGGALARLATFGDSATAVTREASGAEVKVAPPPAFGRAVVAEPDLTAAALPPRILASPFAKRLAKINGIDLAALAGAPGERVRKRHVLAAVEARGGKSAATPAGARAEFEPLSRMRAQIAEAVMLSGQTIPSFVLDRWVETTAIDRARAAIDPEIERRIGVKPTFTDYLLLALTDAFAAHPRLLDRWSDEGARAGLIRASTIDIGLVVALPEGMLVPVLRDLGGKKLPEIVKTRRDAVLRARAGRLLQADYAPVAFSLSNIGASGADRFEAIINPGQSSILAVGRRHERVIARSGAIAVAAGVNLTLTVDHRLIDGVQGAEFLGALAERIERGFWTSA